MAWQNDTANTATYQYINISHLFYMQSITLCWMDTYWPIILLQPAHVDRTVKWTLQTSGKTEMFVINVTA